MHFLFGTRDETLFINRTTDKMIQMTTSKQYMCTAASNDDIQTIHVYSCIDVSVASVSTGGSSMTKNNDGVAETSSINSKVSSILIIKLIINSN